MNHKIDVDRELYQDFKVKLGIQKPEDSSLIFSPEAEFRRKQIKDYRHAGKELPSYA